MRYEVVHTICITISTTEALKDIYPCCLGTWFSKLHTKKYTRLVFKSSLAVVHRWTLNPRVKFKRRRKSLWVVLSNNTINL
jgi:hypothetical protein